jgi:multiple sugar transport system substrate-binding protein
LLRTAGLIGFGAIAVPLLESCATAPPAAAPGQAPPAPTTAPPTSAPVAAATAAPKPTVAAAAAAAPTTAKATALKQFPGVTINSGFVSGENDETLLRDRIADVKDKLGITLTVNDLGADGLHDKIAQGLRAGQSPYAVSAIVGFWLAELIGSGSFEPLDKYLSDPSLTPADFDMADMIDKHLDYIAYWNLEEKRPGRPGSLFLMPGPHSDAHMITYRKDLFDKYGVAGPPKTWDEFVDVARKLNHPADGIYGTAFVGKLDPSISLTDWANRFLSMGGKMFTGSPKDKTVTPHLDSDESIAALENMVRLTEVSPPGVSSYALTEVTDAMSAGKIGMMLMWAVVSGKTWAPDLSKVSDKVAAAVPPGNGVTIRGGWGMGIPKDVKDKEAAWSVIRYYSSKEADKERVMRYGIAPVRKSTLQDAQIVQKYPFMPTLAKLLEDATPYPSITFPESWEMVMEPAKFWNRAVVKDLTPKEAALQANEAVKQILKKGGWNTSA